MKVAFKRTSALVIFLLLFCTGVINAYGDTSKMTANELYASWQENGWPDDVGGFYIDSDKFVIAIVNMNDTCINELDSKISDRNNVDFINCKYSYKELSKVRAQLDEQILWAERKVVTLGIDQKENCIKIGVCPELVEEYKNTYNKLYGDMVFVYAQEPIVSHNGYLSILICAFILIILLSIIITILIHIHRKKSHGS